MKISRINWTKIDVITYNLSDMTDVARDEYLRAVEQHNYCCEMYSLYFDKRYLNRARYITRRLLAKCNYRF